MHWLCCREVSDRMFFSLWAVNHQLRQSRVLPSIAYIKINSECVMISFYLRVDYFRKVSIWNKRKARTTEKWICTIIILMNIIILSSGICVACAACALYARVYINQSTNVMRISYCSVQLYVNIRNSLVYSVYMQHDTRFGNTFRPLRTSSSCWNLKGSSNFVFWKKR